jgi:hypothetical protein
VRHDADEDVMTTLRHAKETLDSEWSAKRDYYADAFTKELSSEVLDIGFGLLEANDRIAHFIRTWRRWRRRK